MNQMNIYELIIEGDLDATIGEDYNDLVEGQSLREYLEVTAPECVELIEQGENARAAKVFMAGL